ncbi:hypothetical protein BUE80_DR009865 [Diplocarpon rosae]|nr:hypothetical protein BUE80_DR009865 [Diplocarpon rosae]
MARPHLMASEESLVTLLNKSFFDDIFCPEYDSPFVVSDMPLNELSPSQTTAMTSNATPELVAPVSATVLSPATVNNPDNYLTAVAPHENTNSDAQQVLSGEKFRLDQGDVNMGLLQGSFDSEVKRPHQAQEHQSPMLNFDHNSQTNALLGNPAHSHAVDIDGLAGGQGITNGFEEAQEHGPDYETQIDVSMADPALLNATLATQGFGGPSDNGPNFTEEEMAERTTQVLETLQSLAVPNPSSSSIHQGHYADDWYNQASQLGSGIPPPLMFPPDMQVGGYDNLACGQQLMQDGDQKVQGFAKIEFPDGHFYLNSYQLKIGRDIVAQRIHKKQMAKAMSHNGGGHGQAKSMISDTAGFVRHFDDEDVIEDNMSRRKRRKERDTSKSAKRFKKSRSSESSSQYLSRRQSLAPPIDATHMYQSSFEQPAKVDVEKHRPSPHKLATVLIHPANKDDEAAWNGISRDHLLIAFNFDKNLWEAHVRGRNGCFLEEEYKGTGEVFPLPNGARLQIGAVLLLWRLPEHIPIGKTGAEEDTFSDEETSPENEQVTACVMNGKEMSLEFAHERRAGLSVSDNDSDGDSREMAEPEAAEEDEDLDNEASEIELGDEDDAEHGLQHQRLFSDASEDEDDKIEEVEYDKDQDEEKDQQGLELELGDDSEEEEEIEDIKPPPKKAPAIKKRGAGRPPKGEKSKRQLMEEKKAAALANEKGVQQADKKTSKKEDRESKTASKGVKDESTSQAHPETTNKPAPEGEKRKVGRPRKHPKPDNASEPREKRKYTKRKPKEPKDGESKAEGATGENEPNDEGKEQKQGRAVRSPSPTFNEEDLTPEQLAKPSCNYVQLIYEALSESPHPKMSLPQIYRAIQRKHPYFVCRVTTVGWQSSVRHNLGQNEGFEKVERDGKGWKWGIKAGATFEKEKKKKSSPQPQYPQGMQPIYPGIAHGYYHPHPGMMMPPPGYQMSPQMPANYRPGQQPYMGHPPAHMNGYYQPGSQPLMNGQPHITIPAALAPPTSTAYSSPYGPKPAAANGPSASEQNAPPPADKPTSPLAPRQSPYHPQPNYPYPPPPQHPSQAYPPQPQQLASLISQPSQSNHPQPQQPIPPQVQPTTAQSHSRTSTPAAVAAHATLPAPPAPPAPPALAAPAAPPVSNAHVDERVLKAVESFKSLLSRQLADKLNGKEILDNSVKKVLGQMPDSAGHPEEKSIVEVLRNMLGKIGLQHPTYHPTQSNDQRSPQLPPQPPQPQPHGQSQQHASHTRTQASASSHSPANSTGPERQNPTIVRPSFHTQSLARPTGTRPSVSSMVRSNSNSSCAPLDHNTPGSPAAALPASDNSGVPLCKNTGPSAPPPPACVSNGANTPKSTGDMGQSKEPGPTEATGNAEESQDFKKSFVPGPLVQTT